MTEHTVTVEEYVETEETVYTCDYCGLGDEAGEMLEYTFETSDAYDPDDNRFARAFHETAQDRDLPTLHFHVSCVTDVATDSDEATAMTLSNQYRRRTGNGLVLAFPTASFVFIIPAIILSYGAYTYMGFWFDIAGVLAFLLWLLVFGGARKTAKATVREFST